MESALWGFESGAGPRYLPGTAGINDALPVLASRPHLDRFLSSARALDLLRPVRESIRRDVRGVDAAETALPQWGTGLPGEDRVLQMRRADDGAASRSDGKDDDLADESDAREGDGVGWGY